MIWKVIHRLVIVGQCNSTHIHQKKNVIAHTNGKKI